MNPLRLYLVFTALFFTQFLFGQSDEKITDAFFKTYKESPSKAYENLFLNNKWMKDKQGDIETVKIKLNETLKILGDYYGYEVITEKSAGESYVLKTFLVKYERQPIRFTFLLYRPKDVWQIQNFNYDANVDDELGEAAKAYRLKSNW